MVKYEEVIVGDEVKTLTEATYGNSHRAVIAVEFNSIRFTYDGTTEPSETVGVPMDDGDVFELETLEQIRQFKVYVGAVASPVVPAKLYVHYENNDRGFKSTDGGDGSGFPEL